MPKDPRLALLSGQNDWQSHPIPERGVRALFFSDGPHGLRRPPSPDSAGIGTSWPATCFPTAATLAASWDPALLTEVGAALGREARSRDVDVVLGPGLNLHRNPLGGRVFEYFSEDPLLSGRLAGAMVRGIQSEGVGACLKHFVANNQEEARMVHDVVVDEGTLRALYLRGFEVAVTEGRPWTIMTAYNRINGVAASESPLIEQVLRGAWGFDGLVLSDWGAVGDRVAALRAGLDLEMPGSKGRQEGRLARALASGALEEAAVERSIERLVRLHARCTTRQAGPDDPVAHHALARRAAAASCVLLRNEDETLPLPAAGSVVVLGALARTPRYQGAGSSGVIPLRLVSIEQALRAERPGLRWAPGYRLDGQPAPALRREAVALAGTADCAVVVLGLPDGVECEGFDRSDLNLPAVQNALVEALLEAGRRVVVVLCHGAPVALPWADRVAAIVDAGLGGQAGGAGLADVLAGRVNPSGRLAAGIPLDAAQHPSTRWFRPQGRRVEYREGPYVGYRWFDTAGLPLRYPFGFGLGYSRWVLRDLSLAGETADGVELVLEVHNEGARAGATVVQVYRRAREVGCGQPAHELVAWARVELDAGASERVRITVPNRAFAVWCRTRRRWVVEAGRHVLEVGESSRDLPLTLVVEREGEAPAAALPVAWSQPRAVGFAPTDDEFAELLGRPVPPAESARPYTAESTLGDLAGHPVGALVLGIALILARRELAPDGDPTRRAFAEAMVRDLPLRGLVNLRGNIGWGQLERLLLLLNGRWWAWFRRLFARKR